MIDSPEFIDAAEAPPAMSDTESDPALADPEAPTTGDPMWELDQDPDEYDETEQPEV